MVGVAAIRRRQIRALAKSTLWDVRGLGPILNGMGQIPIERGAGDAGALARAIETLRAGACIGVFPEGTRSKGKVLRARSGVARLALEVPEAHVTLVSIEGTSDLTGFPRRPQIRIRFFDPVTGQARAGEEASEVSARWLAELRSLVPPTVSYRKRRRGPEPGRDCSIERLDRFHSRDPGRGPTAQASARRLRWTRFNKNARRPARGDQPWPAGAMKGTMKQAKRRPGRGPKGSRGALLTVFAAIGVLVVGFGAVALAGGKSHPIKPVKRSDEGATNLARSIFEGNGKRLVRAKFVSVPPGHDPVARSSKSVAGFPRRGGSFAILSTGCAHLALRKNHSTATGCKDGGVKTRGARDVTILRIRVKVPKGANCLSFRFKFLSEEYPEWVGTEFNDAFIAEVGRAPKWSASTNQKPTIRAPRNFATTRRGRDYISVNGTGVAKVSRAAAKGTTYDAATGKLRASTPVKPGYRLLYLSLFDQGDRQWDSAVFVDRLLVRHSNHCSSGLVQSK